MEQPSGITMSADDQCQEISNSTNPIAGKKCEQITEETNSISELSEQTEENEKSAEVRGKEILNDEMNVVMGDCDQGVESTDKRVLHCGGDNVKFPIANSVKEEFIESSEDESSVESHCKESSECAEVIKMEYSKGVNDVNNVDYWKDTPTQASHVKDDDDCSSEDDDTQVFFHESAANKLSNNIEAPSTSSFNREQDQAPCRVVTQYVFVNKPLKNKAKKKKFGMLYNQAFRHYQREKIKFASLFGTMKKDKEKGNVPKSGKSDREQRLKRRVSLKPKDSDTDPYTDSDTEIISRKKPKSKEKKKPKTKNVKQVSGKKAHSEKAVWKNSKKAERSKQTKNGRRRILNDEEEIEVRNALAMPGATVDSVSAEYGVAKTIVSKFVHEIEASNSKKKKVVEEKDVSIKQETPDESKFDLHEPSQLGDNANPVEDLTDKLIPRTDKLRRELTLEEKAQVIRELQETGCKVAHIARKYGISSSSASRLKKKKHAILSHVESGDMCRHMKRKRDCKAPELDKALLKWYRSIEGTSDEPLSLSNVLLMQKSHDISAAMGCSYNPTINWILRWKYRHNIVCKQGRIETREDLEVLDSKVDLAQVLTAVNEQIAYQGALLARRIKEEKAEEMYVCEHCGVVIQGKKNKNKKRTIHLKDCPLYAQRTDLTLADKVKVVRALEKPGVKLVQVARKFSISTSATSRIHRDRVDILARLNEGYINMDRKRSRVSNEPEVEKALCDWYRMQYELGIHISSQSVRDKAKDIAAGMGKDFSPSESWVFRWRHRNNVNGPVDIEGAEEEDEVLFDEDEVNDKLRENGDDAVGDGKDEQGEGDGGKGKKKRKRKAKASENNEPKRPKIIFPKSVMCEKCGCVSVRLKNNRIRSMRHSKGCPLLKPRCEMTYEERIKMLRELEEPGATLSSVAKKYGISTSSMSRMRQNRENIITQGHDLGYKKRIRDCKEPEVAKQLYVWYLEKEAEGIHVTGTKLKEKASKMAKDEGRDFKVSTGWLGRWKKRHNIAFKRENVDKVGKVATKRKNTRKSEKRQPQMFDDEDDDDGNMPSDFVHMNDVDNAIANSDVGQAIQTPRMYFAQRYHQNPWDLAAAQQASTSCARPKDFIATAGHGISGEDNQGPYSYDPLSSTTRHMFHHSFETFALSNGYSVSMGVPGAETALPVPRDFLQTEENEMHLGMPSSSSPSSCTATAASTSSHHLSHSLLHQHSQVIPQAQSVSSLISQHVNRPSHLLHVQDMALSNRNGQEQQQHQHQQLPSPTSGLVLEEDNSQENQVMEAFKIMSSFAQKKSLGADVQAALRTIEMTMKGAGSASVKKGSKKNSYTNM